MTLPKTQGSMSQPLNVNITSNSMKNPLNELSMEKFLSTSSTV